MLIVQCFISFIMLIPRDLFSNKYFISCITTCTFVLFENLSIITISCVRICGFAEAKDELSKHTVAEGMYGFLCNSI